MSMENCKHDKQAPKDVLRALPESQAGEGRHKCAVCAYDAGYKDGLEASKRLDERKSG